ncbi:hypothetical protein IQ22_04477 [Pseudomonas duriflava]|uniref:Uncharacterized protein n=1 Tax=Pseudomonas duriflava TaxID=459528 RepID=A0A562PQI3_9PSED|nr:hypothetical protein IQ22_04477 [Pseudomonas duriflava]
MSNRSLVASIENGISAYEQGNLELLALECLVVNAGSALEAMPYHLIQQFEEIRGDLQIDRFRSEDGFVSGTSELITRLRAWLDHVPK